MATVVLSPRFIEQLNEIEEYLNEPRPGAGFDLVAAISDIVYLLEQQPEMYAIRVNPFRLVPVARYSYHIYYFIQGDEVVLSSIYHGRRKVDARDL